MEFMTALQSTFDDHKPSLFELLTEQQLATLHLPRSLRYLVAVATQQHPRYLLRVLNSFDELYAILVLLVERQFLKSHGGGFTENFYGLKREKAVAGEVPRAQRGAPAIVRETLALTEADIWRNLAVMVGLPYLKRKLDEAYDINAPRALLGAAYTRLPPNPTIKQRLLHYYRWFLRNIYPSINAAYYFSLLAFNLAYLFDNTKYHSPFLWLIGTRMRRLGEADYQAIAALDEATTNKLPDASRPGTTSIFAPRTLYPRILSSLKFVIPTSIFALKFLEWWYATDLARQLSRKATEGLELPPPIISGLPPASPPSKAKVTSATTSKPYSPEDPEAPSNPAIALPSLLPIFTVPAPTAESSEDCPICLGPIQNPTACQTGYVFCYTCIHRWLEGDHDAQERFMSGNTEGKGGNGRQDKWESGKGRCAVTGRRVLGGAGGLRRIMV